MANYYRKKKIVYQTCPHCKTQTAHHLFKSIDIYDAKYVWVFIFFTAGLALPLILFFLEYTANIHCTQCDSLRRSVSFWSSGPY